MSPPTGAAAGSTSTSSATLPPFARLASDTWGGPPPRAKKRLGQHFLTNRGVLNRIVQTAELSDQDTVIEVGPGTGVLTRELAARAGAVVAIELDRDLAARLQQEFAQQPNVRIVQGDILDWTPERLLPQGGAYKVVANLPYYITAAALRHFLAARHPPLLLVALVQYEVAKSITAPPGDRGLLAVAVHFYGRPQLVAPVSPGSFQPAPTVRSAIIRIDTYPSPPVQVPSEEAFFQTVRAGFSARRKQLRNALAQGLAISSPEAESLLRDAVIDPTRRAETLTLEEWASLTRAREEWRTSM